MSNTQVKIGNALLKSLIDMHENKGQVNLEDVGAMFEQMASTMNSESTADTFLRQEITKLAQYLEQAKKEITAMSPEEEDSIRSLSTAGAELDAVVQATEDATNKILDAADIITDEAGKLSDAEAGQKINDAVIVIFDACNFQDITGQRISKVLKALQYLDVKINKLTDLFGEADNTVVPLHDEDEKLISDERPDAELMSGPQMPGSAPSQEDIDKLFNSIS